MPTFISEERRAQLKFYSDETREIMKLSAPIFFSNLAWFGMGAIDTIFLGHLGDAELSSAALGNMWSWCTGFIAFGVTFGMDTLVSQAYGAGNFRLVGILVQNAIFCSLIMTIPVMILWSFAAQILPVLGQNANLSHLAGLFCQFLIIGLIPNILFSILNKYLQNQTIVFPSLVVTFTCFFLNMLLNYIYIKVGKLGFIGSPLATSTSRVLMLVLLLSYIYIKKLHAKTWFGWSREMFSLKRNLHYMRFAVPNGLMILFEVWGFELATFATGMLKTPELIAAHSIGFQSLGFSFMIPLALGTGISTRVGNLLGAGDDVKAKKVARFSIILGSSNFFISYLVLTMAAIMLCNAAVIFFARGVFGKIYTNDPKVIEIASKLLPYAALTTILDGTQNLVGGVLRASGRGHIGTIMNFVGYYLIAIPLYFGLGLGAHMSISGVWIGLIAGLFVISLVDIIFVWRIDWVKERKLAQERAEKSADQAKLTTSDGGEYSAVLTETPEEMEVLSVTETS